VERLNKVLLQLIEHEKMRAHSLLEKRPRAVQPVGAPTASWPMRTAFLQGQNLLSLMRLGVDMEMFPGSTLIAGRSCSSPPNRHLQRQYSENFRRQRDLLRSDFLLIVKFRRPIAVSPSSGEEATITIGFELTHI